MTDLVQHRGFVHAADVSDSCMVCLREENAARVAEIARLRRERDLAVAHDRQPYPTAEAYDRACAALNAKTARLAAKDAEIARLVEALRVALSVVRDDTVSAGERLFQLDEDLRDVGAGDAEYRQKLRDNNEYLARHPREDR